MTGRRKPGPRSNADLGVATLKFSVRIIGQAQLDTWRAMLALSGRRNYQLAADILLEAIRAARDEQDVRDMERWLRSARVRRERPGLRLVLPGGVTSDATDA